MRVIIVGAGISGLSLAISLGQSGHEVVVLDSAAELAELGAGIQMTPQAVKYFFQWGLKDDILDKSIVPERMCFRHWRDGAVVGTANLKNMEKQYGAPYIVTHRALLHEILHSHALRAGAKVLLGSQVTKYNFGDGAVELSGGQTHEADLVVAADGINSLARSQLLGLNDPASQPTGWAAFRMMAEVSKLQADPETASLVHLDSGSSNLWIAPNRSCMTYLVKDATILNIVLSHRDNIDTRDFTLDDYKQTIDELFSDFEPRVRKMIHMALPKIVNYPVYAVPALPHWTHNSGRFTLIGDAAHAMAFYLSMGVSLAVEDAAALAKSLELACPSPAASLTRTATGTECKRPLHDPVASERLRHALRLFESVRKKRCEAVQRASLHAGDSLHMPEGKERDTLYEALSHTHEDVIWPPLKNPVQDQCSTHMSLSDAGGERLGPGGIADQGTRDWCYGYDAIADVINSYNSEIVHST